MRGIPNYDHPYGLIRFDRSMLKKPTEAEAAAVAAAEQTDEFQAFQGQGFSLKKGKK